ncbi:hypothetical protein Pyn_30310 [Prunus yedoensis var. nudiflora]|uniref:Uncharacterized protein n=1 Tax=Prunus yedoensis var. nudiflora TaxID=2094558 RepID=A0A314YC29_PRUYE|nr:hypothetical protein Pyn_30310 [Prunus yedoensis var. nudiflora]
MMSEDGLSIPSTIKGLAQELSSSPNPNPNADNQLKRKRNLPGTPGKYPDAEVIALSPKSLMATNRFVCEICNKGSRETRTCSFTDAATTFHGSSNKDQTKNRKHGEKKWKCEKCSKKYAVQSDWKAHSKVCGTREYRCDCGTLFSRKDSFITHRAFCDALAAEESARFGSASTTNMNPSFINGCNNITNINPHHQTPRIPHFIPMFQQEFAGSDPAAANNSHLNSNAFMPELVPTASMDMFGSSSSSQTQWLIKQQ